MQIEDISDKPNNPQERGAILARLAELIDRVTLLLIFIKVLTNQIGWPLVRTANYGNDMSAN